MYACWEELEAAAGLRLVTRTGGLDLALPGVAEPTRSTRPPSGRARAPRGSRYEPLDAAETMRRWPQWSLPEGTRAIFQADAGVLDIGRACAAHLALARAHGAVVRAGAAVRRLEPRDDGVRVHARRRGARRRARRRLRRALDQPRARRRARVPAALHARAGAVVRDARGCASSPPERFPIWIGLGEPSFYGFPVDGFPAVKVAQDLAGPAAPSPTTRRRRWTRRGSRPSARSSSRHLPAAAGPVAAARACFYDLTPDRGFVLDAAAGRAARRSRASARRTPRSAARSSGGSSPTSRSTAATPHDIAPFRADRWA